MVELGALVNARAGGASSFIDAVCEELPQGSVRVTCALEEIGPALEVLRKRGVNTLVLVGGDGTLAASLTELVRIWPHQEWPVVVVTRGGTVNTIAKALGARSHPQVSIQRLKAAQEPSETQRPLLRVEAQGTPPRCGMIFGNGVATRWLEAYYAAPHQGPADAARLVARTVTSAITRGRFARDLFRPFQAEVHVDGELASKGDFTLIGASTIRDVGLGFQPFHSAEQKPDRFHLLRTDAGPARVALELPAVRLGRELPGSCLRHQSAATVDLVLESPEPWMIDADIYPPAGRLRLGLTPPMRFWAL